MSDFVRKPLLKHLNKQNPITRIENLEASAIRPSATVSQVSQLSPDAGEMVAGTYYVYDPNTGQMRGYLTASPKAAAPGYHLAFFDSAGVFQFGVSADDGSAVAAAGQVVINDDGLTIGTGGLNYIRFTDLTLNVNISSIFASHNTGAGSNSISHTINADSTGTTADFTIESVAPNGTDFVDLKVVSETVGNRVYINDHLSRQSILPAAGWLPYAMQDGASNMTNFSSASVVIAAAGDIYTIPININAPMLLRSVSVWNNDTATERTWNWSLFTQLYNIGSTDNNTLTRHAVGTAAETFTPAGAASLRTIAASSAAVYLPPGLYWLGVQNQHATNTFSLGRIAAVTNMGNTVQNKVVTNPVGTTLDFVAATWTRTGGVYGVRLNGDVFGESAAF